MLEIKPRHLKFFIAIKKKYFSTTKIPEKHNWRKRTNNELWLQLIKQVMVVGSSASAKRFDDNKKVQKEASFARLKNIKNKTNLEKAINHILRSTGTRFASANISKCRKTQALVHNFKILEKYSGGLKGLLRKLSKFGGSDVDIRRIRYLMKIFKFIQSKSARDYLMEVGLVRNAVAFDVRIQNIFKREGIKFLRGLQTNQKLYDVTEAAVLAGVCKPAGLLGVEFDRLLVQNYREIMISFG